MQTAFKTIEHLTTPSAAEPLCTIEGVPVAHLKWYWDEASRLLWPAIERDGGRMTMKLLRKQIEAKDVQLWIALDESQIMIGAWISKITIYPATKVCELLYCGGTDIQLWLYLGLDMVEAWAREKGCDSVTIAGRKGWERIVRHRDYHYLATLIEKKLTHE